MPPLPCGVTDPQQGKPRGDGWERRLTVQGEEMGGGGGCLYFVQRCLGSR